MRTAPTRTRLVAYWLTTLLGPASFVVGGILQLTRAAQPMAALRHLGYPPYLATIIGAWNVLGAIAVVVPRLPRAKEWAYAGFAFLLIGAAASHAAVGDPLVAAGPFQIAPPLVFLALVMASWALRPPSRHLPCTTAPSRD